MLFDSWTGLGQVVVTGVAAYAALVLVLRLSGPRTLAKMNAFDFVVTVALGSTLATVVLSRDVAPAKGPVAFGLLVGLQFAAAWLSVRSATVNRVVKSEPALLLYRGDFLRTFLSPSWSSTAAGPSSGATAPARGPGPRECLGAL